jgi:outer membrane receptor protein involved in Fe transport
LIKISLLSGTALPSTALVVAAFGMAAPAAAQTAPVATPTGPAGQAAQVAACDPTRPAPNAEECAPPASADGTPATIATDGPAAGNQEITVTGSRIRTPNLESAAPVTTITGEQLFETGNVQVGDQLNDLPQLRGTYTTANSTRFLGTRGLNILDLRGLGSSRTLVLVNGRRHVASDVLSTGTSVDINTIPSDLIQRVDVLTGGASAVYGSDAIAGVVNFVLKQDYDGFQLRGQAGTSKYLDADTQFVSALAGKNFADGRGNVTASAEYSHTNDFYVANRPGLRQNNAFLTVDTDPAGSINGSDGIPDRIFVRDIRSTTISLGGQFGLAQSRTNPLCGADATGAPFTCSLLFDPSGQLQPQTGIRSGLAPNGSFLGGNGYSGREDRLIALSPDVKRYSFNVIGHFDISPALTPFFEAKYVRVDAKGSQSGPFFNQGTGTVENSQVALGFNRERIRLDNPFLAPQARALLTAQILAAGVDPNSTSTTPAALTAAQRAAIADGSFRLALRRNYLDLGIRDEDFKRETFRIVGGIRGDFNDDWHYEASVNYGQHKELNIIENNVSRQRYLLAIDTTRNAAGQIVCRSQVTPSAAGNDRAGNPAQLAADVAACVPLNPFGVGNISEAAKNYLRVDSTATGKITQLDAMAYVAGDLSQLFELPGGPIGFSVGGEYRKETLRYELDDYTEQGYAFYNAIPDFESPSFEVKEAFAEVNIPLLRNLPFARELTVKGSGRISDYKGAVGTVKTYGVEGIWSPVRDITFRGAYNRSLRAPNLSELYSPVGQNFTPAPADPCSARNIGAGSTFRSANCTAAGRPAGYDFVYTSSLEIRSGGNVDLKEETSKSLTLGAVVQPRFIPGLSLSADYYDITVKDVITSVGTAQDILNLCYDSATLDNPFCGLFQRAGASGGPNGEIPFQVLSGSLLQTQANFAKLKARGIDTQLNYVRNTGFGRITAQVIWTHQLKNESYTNPANPDFRDVFIDELGDPKDQVNFNLNAKKGPLTLGYQFRWIGRQYLNTYEDYNAVNGLPPQNTDYAEIEKYPAVAYHDLRVAYDVRKNINLYFGVDNVLNKMPPYGLTGVGGGSGIYDNRGRFFYGGFVTKF